MNKKMDAEALLDSLRGLVIAVDGDGTIVDARGGIGGFLGLDVAALPGSNVFEHVRPEDADELAHYFIENVDDSEATLALPMPFRIAIVDGDGFAHPVDIIPTGQVGEAGGWSWTVLLIPVALNGSITRSLDLEMAGAPRDDVKAMLCEELRVDNANYTSRWLMIDFADPESIAVFVARPEDQSIADALADDLDTGEWRPWDGVPHGATQSLDIATFPSRTKTLLDERGWGRSLVAPVYVHDQLAAVFLLVGAVPKNYDPVTVKRNVSARVQSLVRATALLIERWGDQDRLQIAASTDELTGLYNRRELFAALEDERRSGSVLYIDVDDFKSINDRFGHAVGDEALVQLARRIESACRSHDKIGRVGGDEFVVLLPGTDATTAEQIARRIIGHVAMPIDLEVGTVEISVSVGLAQLDSDDALDVADQAMLRAKRAGCRLVSATERD